jgi:hypothetical protein
VYTGEKKEKQHATISNILLSYSSYKEISQLKNDLGPNLCISDDWAGRGAALDGSQAHPLGSQAQPNRISFPL